MHRRREHEIFDKAMWVMRDTIKSIKSTVEIASLASVIAICSFLVFPIGPVPVTLQTMAIALAGMCLGSSRSICAVLLYIMAGICGAPVFAGGKAGLGVLIGPTGGYLVGFIIMSGLCGLVNPSQPVWKTAAWLLLGLACLHFCGIAGQCLALRITLYQALLVDAVFLPGDLLKTLAAFLFWRMTRARNIHD